MSLYVYITEECLQEAERQNRADELNRLKTRIEETNSTPHLAFHHAPFFTKRLPGALRLIAERHSLQQADKSFSVLVFLGLFPRGSSGYSNFLTNNEAFVKNSLHPRFTEQNLRDFLEKREKEDPLPQKQQPTEIEQHYLYQSLRNYGNETEQFVCESEEWVAKISDSRLQPRLSTFFDGITPLFSSETGETEVSIGNHRIIYRWIPEHNKLFLAGIAETTDEAERLHQIYETILKPEKTTGIAEEEILRSSIRSYPALVLADDQIWFDIQQD